MNRIVKDTLKIFIITAVAGLLLGGVYVITKEPIAQAEAAAKQAAYKEVFHDASEFVATEVNIEEANDVLKENGYDSECFDEIVAATDASGNIIGYVFSVTTSAGYGGDISYSVGIKNDGTVNGYSILSISETAGLGMKATEEEFKSQYENKRVEQFLVTKTGATSDNEIDAISGATITSNAITDGINACLYYMHHALAETEVE